VNEKQAKRLRILGRAVAAAVLVDHPRNPDPVGVFALVRHNGQRLAREVSTLSHRARGARLRALTPGDFLLQRAPREIEPEPRIEPSPRAQAQHRRTSRTARALMAALTAVPARRAP